MANMCDVEEAVGLIWEQHPELPLAIASNSGVVIVIVGEGDVKCERKLGMVATTKWIRKFEYKVLNSTDPNSVDKIMRPLTDLFARVGVLDDPVPIICGQTRTAGQGKPHDI